MRADKVWADICAKWSTDEEFRDRLLTNPKVELAKAGMNVADDVRVIVHQTQPYDLHLVMPPTIDGGLKAKAINDGSAQIMCSSEVRGGTCFTTDFCGTRPCSNTAC